MRNNKKQTTTVAQNISFGAASAWQGGAVPSAKGVIPVFFAADDNYVPFLAVTLQSIAERVSEKNEYRIYILHSGVRAESVAQIKKFEKKNFTIEFVDVSERLETLSKELQLRDYYSCATYYRIFIAVMFPQYDKAIYLDCDLAVRCDLAEYFRTELSDNYVAGVPDGAVGAVPVFKEYTKRVLGIDSRDYFNAGVLLLNLKALREEDFYGKFSLLIKRYKFTVAQDQDYLNVLCKGRVKYLSDEWNAMPVGGETQRLKNPKIIHYNLTMKPWHYENILYREYFWESAKRTEFYDRLQEILKNYGEEEKRRDFDCEAGLLELCKKEIARADNYWKIYGAYETAPRKTTMYETVNFNCVAYENAQEDA